MNIFVPLPLSSGGLPGSWDPAVSMVSDQVSRPDRQGSEGPCSGDARPARGKSGSGWSAPATGAFSERRPLCLLLALSVRQHVEARPMVSPPWSSPPRGSSDTPRKGCCLSGLKSSLIQSHCDLGLGLGGGGRGGR